MGLLDNYTFVVGIINTTFSMVTTSEQGTVIGHSGRDFYLLETLSQLLGFRYQLKIPDDKQYGVLKNGKWNGLVGMIIRNETQFAATTMAWSHNREQAIRMSEVCNQDKFVYVTKQIVEFSVKSSYFFAKPFQRKVWLLVGLFITCSLIFLPSLRLIFPKYSEVLKTFTLWHTLSLMMGIANPRSLIHSDFHGLAVGALLIILGVVLKIYGSTLASSVSENSTEKPIDTIEELVDAVQNKNLSVGILKKHSVIQVILQNSMKEELIVISRRLKERGQEGELTFPAAIEAIMESHFALIIGVQTFVQLMNDHKASMRYVHVPKETLLTNNKAMILSKTFPHSNIFDKTIRRIKTNGLMYKWEAVERFKLERDLAKMRSPPNTNYIDMMDLEYIVVSLFVLKISFLLVLLAERLHSYWRSLYIGSRSDNYQTC